MYFNFNEINILIQNLNSPNKEEFIKLLHYLKNNTKDAMLLHSIKTLTEKLIDCSEQQFKVLYKDIKEGNVSASDGYLMHNY